MSEPAELRVSDALDKLIHQFSDPLSFYREVIQNALDAGSQEVEIRVTFEAGAGDRGLATIHVDDWGEGMTREIIEKRLTRLFSSSKDGDRTKIGKFGIGFVSIFATEPELVCIDTSREGEHWRVLFKADRRFELRRLEVPVDGTKIRIFKPMSRREFEALEGRSREVIRYWCKHTRGEIRYQGEVLSEPLGLDDAPIQVREESDASILLVGHPEPERSFFGLYNRGLTLLEGGAEHHRGLAFKISSDHLEHTLTRDNVIEDEGYHRLLARLRALIDGDLARAVFARLDAALRAGEAPGEYLYRAAAWHLVQGRALPRELEDAAVACSPSGRLITLGALRRALAGLGKGKETVLRAGARSPLTDALEAREQLIVEAAADGPLCRITGALGAPTLPPVALYCLTLPPADDGEARRFAPLQRAAEALLTAQGSKLAGVAVAHFTYPESAIAGRVAVSQRRLGDVDRCEEVRELGASIFSRRRVLVVNADHPTVAALVNLAQREPEFAAYVLAKLFFLGHRLDADLDGELARLAIEQRGARRVG